MSNRRKLLVYLGISATVVLAYTFIYQWGIAFFENETRSFFKSLSVVVQSMTTTGYGEDAGNWDSAAMNLMTITMQITGILLIFMTLPLFVVPLIEESFKTKVPESIDKTEGHIVVCEFSSKNDTLVEEFETNGADYVVIEPDEETAIEMYEDGLPVIHGDPESTETLEKAHVGSARIVVVDSTDERNATIALSIREMNPDVHVISLIEDPSLEPYLRYAGADEVLSPRHILGDSLAEKAKTAVSAELGETIEIGEDFELIEFSVQKGSEMCDATLAEIDIRERTGASVIGAWIDGDFVPSPDPETYITENTVVLVAGREEQLEELKEMTRMEAKKHSPDKVIVVGYGEVGKIVCEDLKDSRTPKTVVNLEEGEEVDVVGDATDKEVLLEAGIEDARALIVALPDDIQAIFTTLVAQDLSDIETIVRANEEENIGKIYRAGADFVLALKSVSGRMLASKVFEEDVVSVNKQVKIIRTEANRLAGKRLADAKIQSKTGCVVIAVERNGEIITQIDAGFVPDEGDRFVIAGSDEDVNVFESEFVE